MDQINNVEIFEKLTKEEKQKLYNDEILRIEAYIYKTSWYLAQPIHIKLAVRACKPWLIYKNIETGTPVRLYGYIEQKKESPHSKPKISYLVATMEDDESNSISFGIINDIQRISSISWKDIDQVFVAELKKAESYGGDMIFLKPEMFLFLSKIAEDK